MKQVSAGKPLTLLSLLTLHPVTWMICEASYLGTIAGPHGSSCNQTLVS